MVTTSNQIKVLAAEIPIAQVAAEADAQGFVVTRSSDGSYFALRQREAELLAAELPDETLESALKKASWSPSRVYRELLLSVSPAALRNNSERVVVIDASDTPTAVLFFEKSQGATFKLELPADLIDDLETLRSLADVPSLDAVVQIYLGLDDVSNALSLLGQCGAQVMIQRRCIETC